MTFNVRNVTRRQLLAGTGAALLMGTASRGAFAEEPEKPAEIIVRAWGGSWGDALKAGVSDPFTKLTGIAVRHDLTEDNEIKPKIWAAVDQGRVPPIHVNWDTTTNATKSALRGVTEDLSDIPNLKNAMETAKPVAEPRVRAMAAIGTRWLAASFGSLSWWARDS